MVSNPLQAYGAVLVVGAAVASGTVIFAGFIDIEFVMDLVTVWGFIGAVVVMVVCAVISLLTDLPGILAREFGSGGN